MRVQVRVTLQLRQLIEESRLRQYQTVNNWVLQAINERLEREQLDELNKY